MYIHITLDDVDMEKLKNGEEVEVPNNNIGLQRRENFYGVIIDYKPSTESLIIKEDN